MAQPVIKTSFASGEWAPKLRSRIDVQKYHAGAALMRNFFVDYAGGGASTRQGTRYIATAKANGARLLPFQASANLSYVLEFGEGYIRFYSNGAVITDPINPLIPYEITTPYAASDLFPNQSTGNPGLKFVQDVTSLIICHPSYAPAILTITASNNWSYQAINFSTTIGTPTGLGLTTTLGAGTFNYAYTVTAVDVNGQESAPATPALLSSYLDIVSSAGTIKLAWTAVDGAVSYNVYRTSPTVGAIAIQSGVQYGFIGNVTGVAFTESTPGVAVDFSQTPPITQNPFAGGSITALTLGTNANYTAIPTITIDPPTSGDQATGSVFLTSYIIASNAGTVTNPSVTTTPVGQIVTFPNGVTAVITAANLVSSGIGSIWAVITLSIVHGGTVNSGSTPTNPVTPTAITGGWSAQTFKATLTWHIGGLLLASGGSGYTIAPNVTFSSGAATATATVGPQAAGNPAVPAFFQERLVLASPPGAVQTFYMSQPGSFFNFNISNPSLPDDAITGTIISEQLNEIRSLVPVPTGLMALTGEGAWLINGGGGISTSNPITPASLSATPQAFNGANDLRPLKVNFDVLFGTNKGGYVRDQAYNIYANIFTGSDITTLSNHLFFNYTLVDWTWAEEPFKLIWAIRNDGALLSCAFVKEQELIGWSHHDTNGQFLSVCSVIETVGGNVVDAVYFIVQRLVSGSPVQYVERMTDRYFPYGSEDSWSVDAGLQTAPAITATSTLSITGNASTVGNSVTLSDPSGAFTSTMASQSWRVKAAGGTYKVTAYSSATSVTAQVLTPPTNLNLYATGNTAPTVTGYTIWQPVTTVSGLNHLEGKPVVGIADGVAIGPFTVSGGSVTLGLTGYKVTIGLVFTPQLQTLPIDTGEPTVQGKRKKLTAVTLRVADTLGLQVGTTFANVVTMKDFQFSAIPSQSTGPVGIPGVPGVLDLVNPGIPILGGITPALVVDGRQILDQAWQENGQLCIQQNLPYPATILAVIPEVLGGDSDRSR